MSSVHKWPHGSHGERADRLWQTTQSYSAVAAAAEMAARYADELSKWIGSLFVAGTERS